eukprot:jgi/Chlat1/664/Chrsp104S01152
MDACIVLPAEAQEEAVNGASWQQSQQRDSSQQQSYTRQGERRYQGAYTDYAGYDEDPDDDGQYLYEDQEVYENEGEGGNLFANLGALGQASTMLYNRMRQVLQAVVQAILSGVPFRIPQALVGNGINGLLILVVLWVARALLEVLLYAGIVLFGVFLLARALAFARSVGGGDRGFRYRDGGRRQRRRRGQYAYQYQPDYVEEEEYYDEPAPRRPPPPPPRRRRQAPLAEEPVLRNAWNEPYAWDSHRQQTQNLGTYADDADDRWMDWLR